MAYIKLFILSFLVSASLVVAADKVQATHGGISIPPIPRIQCHITVLNRCRQAVFLGTSCPAQWVPGTCI